MNDAVAVFATRNYEDLLGDSYADEKMELEYLRAVCGQHIAANFRLEHENTMLQMAVRPELVAERVAVQVEKAARDHVEKVLAMAVAGVNKSLLPRIELIRDARVRCDALEKRQFELDARMRLLLGEFGLLARSEAA